MKTISLVIDGVWTAGLERPEMLCVNPMESSGKEPGWSEDGEGIVTVDRIKKNLGQ